MLKLILSPIIPILIQYFICKYINLNAVSKKTFVENNLFPNIYLF